MRDTRDSSTLDSIERNLFDSSMIVIGIVISLLPTRIQLFDYFFYPLLSIFYLTRILLICVTFTFTFISFTTIIDMMERFREDPAIPNKNLSLYARLSSSFRVPISRCASENRGAMSENGRWHGEGKIMPR